MTKKQFHHLGTAGVSPRKGAPQWSCTAGITAEGARVSGAANHAPYRRAPEVLSGGSPLDAGRQAIERAKHARDAKGRRLRRDGVAMLCGVVSYPIPRKVVDGDLAEKETYRRWLKMTVDWVAKMFGSHLASVVEHADEDFLHVHYYVVPELRADDRLNLNEIHPGRRAKAEAAKSGATKKAQDRAYRLAMSAWQDQFHREVSIGFDHDRFGRRRARLTRMEHKRREAIRAEEARRRAELDAARVELERQAAEMRVQIERERAAFEHRQAEVQAEIERKSVKIEAAARDRGWRVFAQPYADVRKGFDMAMQRYGAEQGRRRAAEAEVAELRARLAELEAGPSNMALR